jgi:hypothetical protein
LTRIDLKTNYEKEIPAFIKKKWNWNSEMTVYGLGTP